MKKSSQSALQLWLTLASIPVLALITVYLFGTLAFDEDSIIEIDTSLSKEDMNSIPDMEAIDLDREFTAPLDQPVLKKREHQQPTMLPDLPAASKEQSLTQMLSKKKENLRLGSNGHPVLIRVQENDDLQKISDRYLGSTTFWPYIYMVNKEKLTKPDAVKAGMTLYLPDSTFYNINQRDTLSIKKAEAIAETLNKE